MPRVKKMPRRTRHFCLASDADIIANSDEFRRLVEACDRFLDHYDYCVRDRVIGDEPGIADIREVLRNLESV